MVDLAPATREYKVFRVPNPHPRTRLGHRRLDQPPAYFVSDNCADATYDVLRAFGVVRSSTRREEHAQRSGDALPGPSYPIPEHPHIPLAPAYVAQLERAPVKQIVLEVPTAMPAVASLARSWWTRVHEAGGWIT